MVKMTKKQAAFVAAVKDGKDGKEAAALAGYQSEGRAMGSVGRSPVATFALLKAAAQDVLHQAAPDAARVLVAQLSDKDKRVAQLASRTILDRVGLSGNVNGGGNLVDRSVNELSAEELRERIAVMDRELAERAKPIVESSAKPTQAEDII